MWHDNETTVDYLNFGVVADACASLLRQSRGEPISIGVSGGWGAGKSSLVKMIAARLETPVASASLSPPSATGAQPQPTDHRYVVITFNPWLYQDFESARSALLQIVGDEVLKLAKGDETLLKKALDLLKRINLLRLAQFGGEAAITITTGVPVGAIGKAIGKVSGLWNAFTSDGDTAEGEDKKEGESLELKADGLLSAAKPISLPNEIHAFRTALEKLLEELGITLVVFVDDLDRCLPETAISTLESIRLLLFLKRTAFVIAADNEFIHGAVKKHFEGTGITSDIATNYFDKLIQVPLHVPRIGVNEAKAYLVLLLLEREARAGTFPQDKFDQAKLDIPQRLARSWLGETITSTFLNELVGADTRLQALMELAQGLATLMFKSSSISANPRLMKRFLNTVYLRESLALPQGITLDIPALAKWHLLERYKEELADTLSSMVSSENDGQVAQLLQAETLAREGGTLSKPFEEPFVKEWLQLAPALGTMDLRPLLHLSRDTATRDFGDDNMTPDARVLRDVLKVATSANEPLTNAINAVDGDQAELAMVKAWQGTASSRTWKATVEMIILIEPCKVYPALGRRAAGLLSLAPLDALGPGIMPVLAGQSWATEVLRSWAEDAAVNDRTKRAITAALRSAV
ncbi:NTPase KAP [Pseudomonas syringae pv. actinidifoliorum]|uniref:KAP family P-loop NTPase fold protein n=1 Tax=Pseudomonas syringae TaxID=317 RepID=UPI0013727F83|nr:P-loop NTPase fold protein [Pseudomonas syringae]NAS97461.1 NTPase KAP [Pseudomonas syringae pv. actinidifoliorum]NAT62053.1 NTPase KAP [Pseudomonas syringae pv. actinidifoliorum]